MMPALTGAMRTALRDYPTIWRATVSQRDPRALAATRWLIGVSCFIAAIVVLVIAASHKMPVSALPGIVLRILFGICTLWLTIVWAGLFVPASVQLNSPANARLLPRQRHRLRQMAAAGWLLTTAGFAVALGIPAALPLIGLYMLGFMLVSGGNRWAMAVVIVFPNWGVMLQQQPSALLQALDSGAGLLASTGLLLAAIAWALHWLYPAGGDAHLDKRDERLKRIARLDTGKGLCNPGLTGPAGWGIVRVYRAALRADSRRAHPGTLLMHALGPAAHWSTWLPSMALLLVLGIGVRLVMTWSGGALDAPVQVAANIGAGPLVMLILFSTAHYGQQMGKTRGEQALLRLTPLAGAAALLNRRLAGQLLRHTLVNWAMLTVLMLVLVVLIGGDRAALLRQLGLCCLAGQVALAGLLGDYAGGFGWNWALGMNAAAVAALQAGVAVVLGLASGGIAWIWVWLVVIAVATAFLSVRRDWRRMLAAPPAFPAGRLA
jgi:hypothetical protein